MKSRKFRIWTYSLILKMIWTTHMVPFVYLFIIFFKYVGPTKKNIFLSYIYLEQLQQIIDNNLVYWNHSIIWVWKINSSLKILNITDSEFMLFCVSVAKTENDQLFILFFLLVLVLVFFFSYCYICKFIEICSVQHSFRWLWYIYIFLYS